MTLPAEADGQIDAAGWLSGCERIDSPNHDVRPTGEPIRLIVIHAISLPPGQFGGSAVDAFFTNRLDPAAHPYFAGIAGQRVSAHFFIRRDGRVTQFVSCCERAWHAGVSCWLERERCNDFSLGIELEGDDQSDFAALQYQALNRVLATLQRHYPIEDIVGHADIASGRKTDPGPRFDWRRVAVQPIKT
ncbi:MAG: 1,6-anhydro-N-acetylmuramyl-L-alanine amidase AmpD [Gammaproteobacteria bacterium]|nr:1,6-anhydro-N-acetylmuramyl-L-alanine amidase AmpD [Rhodocyclaceae bacterium]MBU3908071.1 1,6-anhydro-N-acetylmuramyl-L-alanine amidase AmpD [Gammaproteobacteria bacterium]MBU3989574.1 1,6-anhydro-N-acetylmuramyl-L-alanine amidase AmpD [Gammaproteobacteria bacterium]MBU4005712.1 1,6-anhydro-N-acetylmuramyl-L-alanine amidase AmpD [Gammaproteobacteria bacterium]MBU4021540.1 1,6-anhydro-N-acetylmuramyl-L-alanine amidase AmpD [Gammaproteobacteria bacterium]